MAAKKKMENTLSDAIINNDELIDKVADKSDASQTYNPLLMALRENDKKNLFKTNVTTAFHKTGFHLFDYYFGSVINIHDDLGNIIKQEGRVGQAAGTFNLIIGDSGSGKAQPVSTKIPTPNGYKLMGDLKVGDKVFTITGEQTKVLGVYPQGVKDVYKITFDDGRTALCCEDHLWEVQVISHGRYVTKVLDLKSIMKDYKRKDGSPYRRYMVPTLEAPVEYNHKDVPIDPYVIGALIGNGILGENELSISGTYEVPEVIGKKYNFYPDKRTDKNYTWTFIDKNTLDRIKTMDFLEDLPELINSKSHNKKIPDIYLYNDYETRMELLRGLMDTDGSITYAEGRFTVSYSSCSKVLLKQIQELIRSLGFNANISIDKRVGKYRNGFHGTLIFRVPNYFKPDMFSYTHKAIIALDALQYDKNKHYEYIHIKEIEYSHQEECQCIYVEHPSHLYVTDQYVVTHNTTLAAQIAANIIRQYKYANVIHYDCEYRFDVSRCETITKLPASYFDPELGERYMIKTGLVGLDIIQEMIVKTYVNKMKLKKVLEVSSGFKDEFGKDVIILQPTIIIIDSITTVLNETFNPDSQKEASKAEEMRGNTEGARDAKTLKGFFKDILPLCKEANIILYGINHINTNMSMNAFIPVARQQNFLKQNESIPGGKTMLYYPFNIIKLTAKPSDDFNKDSDGFSGHVVMVEPVKSSSNQSGNNSKGVSFELVFSFQHGFDSLRSIIMYGRDNGLIDGNKNRMKFKGDDSFTFTWKEIEKEVNEKPIWESIGKFIIPTLEQHLSFVEPNGGFDDRSLNY